MKTTLNVLLLSGAVVPTRNNITDSGLDLYCLEDTVVPAGTTVLVKTGVCVQVGVVGADEEYNVPGGWTLGLFVWDKSGLACRGLKTGAGVVDNAYTGEVSVVVTNIGGVGILMTNLGHLLVNLTYANVGTAFSRLLSNSYTFKKGEKLANLVVQRVELPTISVVTEAFPPTSRSANGYGSSGQ